MRVQDMGKRARRETVYDNQEVYNEANERCEAGI